MQRFTVITIDDETYARKNLKYAIEKNLHEIQEIWEASSGSEGIELIKAYQPDLVFLDIDMPQMNGFEMIKKLKVEYDISIKVVFITGFETFALEAIKMTCLDYLLKPINVEDLKVAFEKFKAEIEVEISVNELMERITVLEENLADWENSKLLIKLKHGSEFVNPRKEILYLQADNNCTYIHMVSGQKPYQTKVLKYYEFLESKNFVRIHQSYLVNMDFVQSWFRKKSDANNLKLFVVMSNGEALPISRSKRKAFIQLMKEGRNS